jgi:hypothetical protein
MKFFLCSREAFDGVNQRTVGVMPQEKGQKEKQ